jgi:hypothetical protein
MEMLLGLWQHSRSRLCAKPMKKLGSLAAEYHGELS